MSLLSPALWPTSALRNPAEVMMLEIADDGSTIAVILDEYAT